VIRRLPALVLLAGAPLLAPVAATAAAAPFELPPTCAESPGTPDPVTPIPELRKRVESLIETDPTAAVQLLCSTIPRVAREKGEDSVEMAWWVGSLATPLIAFMDRHAEAEPLLAFALPILEKRLGPDAPEVAEIHVAHAWSYFRQGRLADSGREWEAALAVREKNPGPKTIELQKVLVGLAQVRVAQREFTAARVALDRTRRILEENGETIGEAAAAVENVYTNLAMREENFGDARRHAEEQIRIETAMKSPAAQLVTAWVLLGQVLERLDEYEESERALREALRLSESPDGPLQRHALPALMALGRLLNDRGKPEEALEYARRALETGEAALGPDAPSLVRVLGNLGLIERTLGRLPEALHDYERAGRIIEARPADIQKQILVAHYDGLGRVALELGEEDMARAAFEAGLAAAGDDPTLSTERAGVLLSLAEADRARDPEESRARLQEALELYRRRLPDSHPVILRVINGLCGLEIDSPSGPGASCGDARTRLGTARETEPSLAAAVLWNQSRAAEARDDLSAAHDHAVSAVSAAAALGTPEPLWRDLFRVAGLLDRRGDRRLAIFFGKQSITEIERLRGHFTGEDLRFDRTFLRDKTAVYRAIADWLMAADRMDEGIEVLGLLKSEELSDFVTRGDGWPAAGAGVTLTAEEESLREAYAKALAADRSAGAEIARLGRLRETGKITPAERERLDALLAEQSVAGLERTARLGAFIAGGRAAGAAPAVSQARPIRADRLAAALERSGPGTAIGIYVLTETHLRLLVATRIGQSEHLISVDGAALRADIGKFLDGISRRADVTAGSRRLYDVLARPLDAAARKAGAKRLVLWLDGALRYVPFAALSNGKAPLVERYAIETYAREEKDAPPRTARALQVRGLGVTLPVAGYSALPAVADELCAIVKGPIAGLATPGGLCTAPGAGNGAIPGEGFADRAFTEARFEEVLDERGGYSVLHLGTHFSLRPGNALRSFLVLGDGSRMTLDTLSKFDLTGLELLTLSACQTGLGGAVTDDGREVEGLTSIVQKRGARRVVASLWQVEDASTARLMKEMYGAFAAAPGEAARALQKAQLSLRRAESGGTHPWAHPYYWAGFVMSGTSP